MERRDYTSLFFFLWEIYRLSSPLKKSKPTGKYFKEEGIFIIQISKEEALILSKKYRIKFGSYGGISTTHTKKHKKYFLTESTENMKCLSQIRKAEHRNSVVKGNVKCEKVGG